MADAILGCWLLEAFAERWCVCPLSANRFSNRQSRPLGFPEELTDLKHCERGGGNILSTMSSWAEAFFSSFRQFTFLIPTNLWLRRRNKGRRSREQFGRCHSWTTHKEEAALWLFVNKSIESNVFLSLVVCWRSQAICWCDLLCKYQSMTFSFWSAIFAQTRWERLRPLSPNRFWPGCPNATPTIILLTPKRWLRFPRNLRGSDMALD